MSLIAAAQSLRSKVLAVNIELEIARGIVQRVRDTEIANTPDFVCFLCHVTVSLLANMT